MLIVMRDTDIKMSINFLRNILRIFLAFSDLKILYKRQFIQTKSINMRRYTAFPTKPLVAQRRDECDQPLHRHILS